MLMQQGFGADIQWLALQYSKMFRQSANVLETLRPGADTVLYMSQIKFSELNSNLYQAHPISY